MACTFKRRLRGTRKLLVCHAKGHHGPRSLCLMGIASLSMGSYTQLRMKVTFDQALRRRIRRALPLLNVRQYDAFLLGNLTRMRKSSDALVFSLANLHGPPTLGVESGSPHRPDPQRNRHLTHRPHHPSYIYHPSQPKRISSPTSPLPPSTVLVPALMVFSCEEYDGTCHLCRGVLKPVRVLTPIHPCSPC